MLILNLEGMNIRFCCWIFALLRCLNIWIMHNLDILRRISWLHCWGIMVKVVSRLCCMKIRGWLVHILLDNRI